MPITLPVLSPDDESICAFHEPAKEPPAGLEPATVGLQIARRVFLSTLQHKRLPCPPAW